MSKIVFITGTDTGVGKTVLTALLLAHLRAQGVNALALKPYCSGGRGDAELLHAFQKECLTLEEVNPYYFDNPVAPGAEGNRRSALKHIQRMAKRCELLLVEGSGGLRVPLAKNFDIRDLIESLACKTIVVSANRLGTINHTVLTVESLQLVGIKDITIALMEVEKPDISAQTNPRLIAQMLPKTPLFRLPFLGKSASSYKKVKKSAFFLKKPLHSSFRMLLSPTFFR